jgi:hypothetical protein
VSYVITAIFGLLAFVIGLTFSIAIERFETRRGLVAEEANAISTAYLRASLLDDPSRTQIQGTLHEYAHSRIALDGLWHDKMDAQLANSLALRKRLWDETHDALMPVRETELASYFIDAMNETLNVGTRRQMASREHIPTRILEVLLLYLVVSAVVLGYVLRGEKGGRRHTMTVLLLLFAIMFVLILDIDRPQSGSIRIPQRALDELVATLDRDMSRRHAVQPKDQHKNGGR